MKAGFYIHARVRPGTLETNDPAYQEDSWVILRHNGVFKMLRVVFRASYIPRNICICPWDFGYVKRYPERGSGSLSVIKEDYPRED